MDGSEGGSGADVTCAGEATDDGSLTKAELRTAEEVGSSLDKNTESSHSYLSFSGRPEQTVSLEGTEVVVIASRDEVGSREDRHLS